MKKIMKKLLFGASLLSIVATLEGCSWVKLIQQLAKKDTPGANGNSAASTGNTSGTATDTGTATNTGASTTSWSGSAIDLYLASRPSTANPSPLLGQGAMFETYGRQYSVDPRLIVAISAAETSLATGKCHSTPVVNTHNAWNWFWCEPNHACGADVCVGSSFESWGSGIATVSHFIRTTYLNKGYTNVKLIASKYCTADCDNWVPNVTNALVEMNGDPENLTLDLGQ